MMCLIKCNRICERLPMKFSMSWKRGFKMKNEPFVIVENHFEKTRVRLINRFFAIGKTVLHFGCFLKDWDCTFDCPTEKRFVVFDTWSINCYVTLNRNCLTATEIHSRF